MIFEKSGYYPKEVDVTFGTTTNLNVELSRVPDTGTKPGLHNTGLTNESILRKIPEMTITVNGAVYENVDIQGKIRIKASNVTLRNFRVKSIKFHCEDGYTNLLLEDGEITDPASGTGLSGGNMIVRRVEIHHLGKDVPFSSLWVYLVSKHQAGAGRT